MEIAYKKRKGKRKWIGCVVKVVILIVIFIIGFLIGYFVKKPGTGEEEKRSISTGLSSAKAKFHTAFLDSVSAEKLEENVR